jgi:hypothetical protein
MDITKKYIINGPNNVIRLQNNNKIIYIFGDVHLDLNTQNECDINESYETLNIDQFLVKFFNSTNTEYDLFLETQRNWIDHYINNYKSNYIEKLRQLFSKNMIFKKNKITKSELFPNIRFHYFDFRFEIDEYKKISALCNTFPSFIYYNLYIDDIIDTINKIKDNIIRFKKIINKKSNNKFINKIFNNYNDKNIQKKIIEIVNNYYINKTYTLLISTIDELLEHIYNNYDLIINKYLSDDLKVNINMYIHKKIDIIISKYYYLFELTDIYLIKRILDKDYVKNAIVYTGSAHLSVLSYFLVKYFDFNITHLFYLNDNNINNIKNINDLEVSIKNNKLNHLNMLHFFYYIKNIDINQCINLFDFPKNFS